MGCPARRPGNSQLLAALVAVVVLGRAAMNARSRPANGSGTAVGGSPSHLVAVLDDVVDGELDDPAERLAVEEEQGREVRWPLPLGPGQWSQTQGVISVHAALVTPKRSSPPPFADQPSF